MNESKSCLNIPAKKYIRDSIVIFAEAMDKKLLRDDEKKPAWETEAVFRLRE